MNKYAWYLDITPNQMLSLDDYPIPGITCLPLCVGHVRRLKQKEILLLDKAATDAEKINHPN